MTSTTFQPVIDRPDQLSAEWLTGALRSAGHDVTVASVRAQPVGTGQMALSTRVELDFDGPADGVPSTLVAKLPGPDENKRALVAGIYRTEVEFYRHVADTVSARTPQCHYSAIEDGGARFVLLLEDLAPRVQGDQIIGCEVAEAHVAATNLAGLHGPRWCDTTLTEHDWMQQVGPADIDMLSMVLGIATPMFLERYADRISAEDKELLASVPDLIPGWLTSRSERFAPLHGDYRLDNLLFGEGDDPVATVDWQTVTLGLPARDLAYFLSTSLEPALRRRHEDEIVATYHRALVEHGVSGHSLEQCVDDYRFGMLQGPLITITGAAFGEVTDRGDEMFLAMSSRSCEAIRDLGTLDLL